MFNTEFSNEKSLDPDNPGFSHRLGEKTYDGGRKEGPDHHGARHPPVVLFG
jgi:hypothetical protein